jgi:hypothetical protein
VSRYPLVNKVLGVWSISGIANPWIWNHQVRTDPPSVMMMVDVGRNHERFPLSSSGRG